MLYYLVAFLSVHSSHIQCPIFESVSQNSIKYLNHGLDSTKHSRIISFLNIWSIRNLYNCQVSAQCCTLILDIIFLNRSRYYNFYKYIFCSECVIYRDLASLLVMMWKTKQLAFLLFFDLTEALTQNKYIQVHVLKNIRYNVKFYEDKGQGIETNNRNKACGILCKL